MQYAIAIANVGISVLSGLSYTSPFPLFSHLSFPFVFLNAALAVRIRVKTVWFDG